MILRAVLALGLVACMSCEAFAQQGEPPITSPQDAACRNEARDKVFSAPDPHGLGLRAIGRQIYMACMKRASGRSSTPRRHRRRR